MLTLPPHLDTAGIDFAHFTRDDHVEITQNKAGQLTCHAAGMSFCLDLTSGKCRHRHHNQGKEPLLNALKIKGKRPNRVLDATPGVLKDAWLLAGRGINVVACERHPVMALLQYHALNFAQTDPTCARIDWQFADSKSILTADFLREYDIDSIYLDPMYPHSPNSASVKKDLQLLQAIVGDDNDADALLDAALRACQHTDKPIRVIVKRPPYAPPLANRVPSYESKTGKTRFDVYV